jgi:broad specificity phosphatase PhoE
VALRLRSLLADLDRTADDQRVLLVCHDAVVLLVRYICENLSEAQVLEIASGQSVRNVSITRLERPEPGQAWELRCFNDVSHLHDEPAPVTEHPGDADARPK